jgi:hypothetical protein
MVSKVRITINMPDMISTGFSFDQLATVQARTPHG